MAWKKERLVINEIGGILKIFMIILKYFISPKFILQQIEKRKQHWVEVLWLVVWSLFSYGEWGCKYISKYSDMILDYSHILVIIVAAYLLRDVGKFLSFLYSFGPRIWLLINLFSFVFTLTYPLIFNEKEVDMIIVKYSSSSLSVFLVLYYAVRLWYFQKQECSEVQVCD